MNNVIILRKFLVLISIFGILPLNFLWADIVRLSGNVKDEKNTSLPGVSIVDKETNKQLSITDMDGHFAFDVESKTTLVFSFIGYQKVVYKVKENANTINITLKAIDIALGEARVKAKKIVNKVTPDPTTIEVKGNYFYVKTRVRVPKEIFHTNTRLTVQPVLFDGTTKTNMLMSPLVFDGKEYNNTQTRMYDFNICRDILSPYIRISNDSTKNKKDNNSIVPYYDSIYVKNINHSFACDMYLAIEDYQKILYRDTTTIAKGTVNPLRFLKYDFRPEAITDPSRMPKEEVQLRTGKGETHFVFSIEKSEMDKTNPINQSELSKLKLQLESVVQQKGASLRHFEIIGTASPDGRYETNLKLAKARMDNSLQLILSELPGSLKSTLSVKSSSTVKPWESLIPLLRKDSLNDEADKIESITNYYKNINQQSIAIRKLPFYKLLLEKYLPKLRSSNYSYDYSIFRRLTFEEIKQLYETNYQQLSKYEFWRYYSAQTDTANKAKICMQALEIYPSFMMAANDLSVIKINNGAYNPNLLKPFAGKDAPEEININQVITILKAGEYTLADTVSHYIQTNDKTKVLKAIVGALKGDYANNFEIVSSIDPQNEVLMLLAMKKNKEALKKAQLLLKENAMTFYLIATAQNRMNLIAEADDNLKKAVIMDPSLLKLAQLDGDLNNLLDEQGKLPGLEEYLKSKNVETHEKE